MRPPGTIRNPSFDNDTLCEECFGDTPSFWDVSLGGCVSTFNPYTTALSGGACHGPNFAEIAAGSISQTVTVGSPLRRNDTLTLTFLKVEPMDMVGACRAALLNEDRVEFATTGVVYSSTPSDTCRPQSIVYRVRLNDKAFGSKAVTVLIEKVGGAVCDVDNITFSVLRQ
jgi:hypothetical protein